MIGDGFIGSPGLNSDSTSLTVESLRKAMGVMLESDHQAAIGAAKRTAAFWDAVPDRLRDHPFILLMGNAVGQAVVHPRVAHAMREEYDRICALDDEALAADRLRSAREIREALDGH